jgi:endoglucanase
MSAARVRLVSLGRVGVAARRAVDLACIAAGMLSTCVGCYSSYPLFHELGHRREQQDAEKAKAREKLSASAKQGPEAVSPCGAAAIIDNGEDGNDRILFQDGRSGLWRTARSTNLLTVAPAVRKPFKMSMGGHDSQAAARLYCAKSGKDVAKCALVVDFLISGARYDASKYGGVAFWARRGSKDQATVNLQLLDAFTDARSPICGACGRPRSIRLNPSEQWTHYAFKFRDFRATDGQRNANTELPMVRALHGLSWEVTLQRGEFELWIDDVTFVGCPAAATVPQPPAEAQPVLSPSAGG